ncbi:hypothetical protein FHP25_19585 [Vineibacter terrae]|uniref:Uncharacterized protein n=1 Tax=Vineibacter terrae TaxID=2586908 RepID=A0A5C8PKT1_9HYPH|nr:DUF6880 family protein [Vineibacter terrae]TXL73855.1 hypothetical protein FHP25_19585 [Vineibacter terrae]
MPKTTIKRSPTGITVANLEKLGASRLAALLVEQARHDRLLRETLTRTLAAASGEGELHDYIDRRLLMLAKGREVDREGAKALVRELEQLRQDTIAATDPAAAIGLLRHMLALGPAIVRRAPPPREQVSAWLAAVLADLVRLWRAAPPDPDELVALAIDCAGREDDAFPNVLTVLAPALGAAGLQTVRARLKAALKELPAELAGGRWGAAGKPAYRSGTHAWRLRRQLGEIADLLGDVDGYIALEKAQPRAQVNVRAIVERLVRAGRGAEALAWLDDGRYHNRLIPTLDLRLAALESLGQREEAQALRWQHFERHLDREMLKDYLRHLPDFADFEAEQRAMAHVLDAKSATDALAFLLAWPDIDSVARLVRSRSTEFGATPPDMLFSAGEVLRLRHPLAAVVALRLAIQGVLRRGLPHLIEKAALALAECAALEPPAGTEPDWEAHDTFVERLREAYPRPWKFWEAVYPLAH